MRQPSPLLISMIALASLLVHHVHSLVDMPDTASTPSTAIMVMAGENESPLHDGANALHVIQHGPLSDVLPELCTIGDPAPPASSGTHSHIAPVAHTTDGQVLHPTMSLASVWEIPLIPPDTFRAFLQVFLN